MARVSSASILLGAALLSGAACAEGGGESAAPGSSVVAGGGGSAGSGSTSSSNSGGSSPGPNCGNGIIDADEQCDDGNDRDSDGCTGCVVDCDASELKDPLSHHCYRAETSPSRWQTAENDCATWGGADGLGHLVAIGDTAEQSLAEKIDTGIQWIGANDLQSEGSFVWSSDDPWSYTHWALGDPDDINGSANCVIMNSDGVWLDWDCGAQLGYICERSAAGE